MEITLFPTPTASVIIWTLINLLPCLAFPAALICSIVYLIRLGRRVRRLEEQLTQIEVKVNKN